MPSLITAGTVKAALRDAGSDLQCYDISDSQVAGLQIRVRKATAHWSVRCRLHDVQRRFDLGPIVAGDADVDGGLSLKTARSWSIRVKALCDPAAPPTDPNRHIAAWRAGTTLERLEKALPPPAPEAVPSWTWEHTKAMYLAEVLRVNAESTHLDYEKKLRVPELGVFDGRMVATITAEEMAAAVKAVHARGAESMAEGVARVIGAMWTFLTSPDNRRHTNAVKGEMAHLKAPARSTKRSSRPEDFDPNDEAGNGKLPSEIDCGRALVIARSGVFPPRPSYAMMLILATCQRRRAITSAHAKRFVCHQDEQVWYVPPWSRKSGADEKSHLVPVVGWAADVVLALNKMLDEPGYLFPPVRRRKDATRPQRHATINMLNKYFEALPGTEIAPHDSRYAFATYGRRDLGFQASQTGKREAGLILDHSEAKEDNDVTAMFYDRDPSIARKREMMWSWVKWLDAWAKKAVEADPLLLDREHLCEGIYRKRYGDDRLLRRVAFRKKHGMPLWGGLRDGGVAIDLDEEK
jgi:integrase